MPNKIEKHLDDSDLLNGFNAGVVVDGWFEISDSFLEDMLEPKDAPDDWNFIYVCPACKEKMIQALRKVEVVAVGE